MTRARIKKPDQMTIQTPPKRDLLAAARQTICHHREMAFQSITGWRTDIADHGNVATPGSLWNLGQKIQWATADTVKAIEFFRTIDPLWIYAITPTATCLELRGMLTTAIKVWTAQALSGRVAQRSTSVMMDLFEQQHYLALVQAINMAEEALLELTDTKE
jgi:hypothetical protein